MGTHQFQAKRLWQWVHWTGLQRVLLTLLILSIMGISSFSFIVAQAYFGKAMPEQHPTPPPAVFVSPTPTPTLSGVLRYPLYGGNPHLPEIALTFDDGPNPPYTSQILTLLQRYGVNATFFVIGSHAAAYPSFVQQEYQLGNVVGNHTWSHPNLIKLSPAAVRAQLQSTSNEIHAIIGAWPTVFRPPYGNFNRSVQSIAASLGLSTIMWNDDPQDWSLPGTSTIIRRVLNLAHNGSIILMHDGGGNRSETVAALPTIITTLERRGFHFVTIPRMIEDLASPGTGPTPASPPQLSPEEFFCFTLLCSSASYESNGEHPKERHKQYK